MDRFIETTIRLSVPLADLKADTIATASALLDQALFRSKCSGEVYAVTIKPASIITRRPKLPLPVTAVEEGPPQQPEKGAVSGNVIGQQASHAAPGAGESAGSDVLPMLPDLVRPRKPA